MDVKKLAMVFGVAFLAAGVLGFVPGVTTESADGTRKLLGILEVDGLHNVVHLLTGVVALVAASSAKNAKLYFQVFGSVYALVTLVGFVQGDSVLGIFAVNAADNVFHLLTAAAALYIGFGLKDVKSASASTPTAQPQG